MTDWCPYCFPHSSTVTPDEPYEVTRARELNQLLGPKGTDQAFDFILDLHNTTANTGVCFVSEDSRNAFNLHLCHYLEVVPRGRGEGGQGVGGHLRLAPVPRGLPLTSIQDSLEPSNPGKNAGQGG